MNILSYNKKGIAVYDGTELGCHPHINCDDLVKVIAMTEGDGMSSFEENGFNGGFDALVETNAEDTIVFIRRGNRPGLSRMAANRAAEPTKRINILVTTCGDEDGPEWAGKKVVVTAFYGTLSPREPFDPRATEEDKTFWRNHALVPSNAEEISAVKEAIKGT